MPPLDLPGWLTWIATIIAMLALSVILVQRRAWRKWLALCCFTWFQSAMQVFLLGLRLFDIATGQQGDTIPAINFFVYWIGSGIAGLVQLWMIVEIGCNIAPAVSRILRKVVPMLAVVFLLGVLSLISHSPMNFPLLSTRIAVNLDLAVSLAWLGQFVVLSYGAEVVGLRWRKREKDVALGFTLQAIAEVGMSWLRGELPTHWAVLDPIQNIVWLCAFGVWLDAFLRPEPPTDNPTPDSLRTALNTYLHAIKKMRAK